MASKSNSSRSFSEFVKVTSTTFIVSRRRLCRVSKFFDKAFSGCFLESHTDTVDLYEVPTYYFGLFLEWVTTGQLPAFFTNDCFGPKFGVPTSETIDLLLRNVPWSPPLKSLLTNAIVRFAYFNPVSLSQSEFSEMVDELLEKPYVDRGLFG
ncbi:hypothetical protein D6D01_07957 [Aureobasidium pullulans]|uniref:BTB domain-containing protein n=1 Tax=Aureobasidium pullulans TaxID=5580 RepID=A0A4S9KIS8_AURPU|nr:hypothetical protein D6D01_07957 [Aureobasidium pullulans]